MLVPIIAIRLNLFKVKFGGRQKIYEFQIVLMKWTCMKFLGLLNIKLLKKGSSSQLWEKSADVFM